MTADETGYRLLLTGNWIEKMKLRIKGNSIRLRLLQSEMQKFAEQGRISDETRFGSSILRYSLSASKSIEAIEARFADNEILVLIPDQAARTWVESEQVGFEVEQPVAGGESLSIVIEKDFVCIDRPDDPDRDDAFPNPNKNC